MPRYFFHIDNGAFAPDQVGVELQDLTAARIEAVRAAGEMINTASESFWEHQTPWDMHVTDEGGQLLFTLQFGAKVPSGKALFVPTDGN